MMNFPQLDRTELRGKVKLGLAQQFRHRERVDSRLSQVEFDRIFPQRLGPLKLKNFNIHASRKDC